MPVLHDSRFTIHYSLFTMKKIALLFLALPVLLLTACGAQNSNTAPSPTGSLGNAQYTDYTENLLDKARDGKLVLFFKADWCPTCRAVDNDINENLTQIPANTTIAKVNYDTSTALKAKYGVVRQHTFVQVNERGEKIKLWNGSPTLADILKQIQ